MATETDKDVQAVLDYSIQCIEEDFPFKVNDLPENSEVIDIVNDAVRLTEICAVGELLFVYLIDTSNHRLVLQRLT